MTTASSRSVTADPGEDDADQSPRGLQLATVCIALVMLIFWQSAGKVGADTKLDMIIAPARFIASSLRMWDPLADGGTTQNQAYGYLFPFGTFFLLGHLMHLPAWIVQRAWESLVVVAAFLGTVRLAGLLGIKRFWPRVAAGLAYALAPRMLSELGQISSELMPFAAAPWVLVPLVRGSREGSPRQAGMRSGVALLFAGGVNAAATTAILPLPALWLLTRERGSRRNALARWWVVGTVLACLWWAVPLVVLGRYAPSFLNFIETSAVTTRPTALATSLRGGEHWIAYLGPSYWSAAWSLVSSTPVVLGTALVAAAGLTGLCRARTRDKLFLSLCLVTGLVLLTLGHLATVHPLAADTWRRALDGSVAAFRNVHKFDPVVRLPLSIGVGWAVAGIADWVGVPPWRRLRIRAITGQRAFAMLAVACVSGLAVAPAFANQLIANPRDTPDPVWWHQTANWLAGHSGGGRALIVPAAGTPYYLWGDPNDDALQPYARSPWTARNSIPISQPGYIRLLDQIDTIFTQGTADDTLAPLLARSGIRYVVVRQDLDIAKSGSTPLPFIDTTLANSPGFDLVQRYGPNLDAGTHGSLIDQGATHPGTVLIWQNQDWMSRVRLDPASATVTANGSADNLPQLIAAGVKPNQPVIFGSVPSAVSRLGPTYRLLDDGTRRREASFGQTDTYTGTMFIGQPFRVHRKVHDYLPAPPPALSAYRTIGVRSVTATSSGVDADAFINRAPTDAPWSALDGSLQTAWRAGSLDGLVGQSIQVNLDHTIASPTASIAVTGVADDLPSEVRVTTQSGSVLDKLADSHDRQLLSVPPGLATWIRVTVLATADSQPGYGAGISELSIQGVHAARTLVVPSAGTPDAMRFDVAAGGRPACLTITGVAACDPSWLLYGEESTIDRSFTTSAAATYQVGGQATLRDGPALNQLLAAASPFRAVASSTYSPDPRQAPGAAVDGDLHTGWVAGPDDDSPSLRVHYQIRDARLRVNAVRILPVSDAALTQPTRVTITSGGRSETAPVPTDGIVHTPFLLNDSALTITVNDSTVRGTTSSINGTSHLLPAGIGEVQLLGAHHDWHGTAAPTLNVSCGQGPTVTVDGHNVTTTLTVSRNAALTGQPATLRSCAPDTSHLTLAAGSHRLQVSPNDLTSPTSVSLTKSPLPAAPSAGHFTIMRWGRTSRAVRVVTSAASLLVVPENFNKGWQATLHGRQLPAVTVDGWQQAWVLPAGANGVVALRFTPQRTVTIGLIAGGITAMAVLVLAIVPSRRRPSQAGLHSGQLGYPITAVLVLAAGLLLGSLAGLATAAVVLLFDGWLRRRDGRHWRSAAVGGALIGVAVAVAARPATAVLPAPSGPPLANNPIVQVACIFAVALVLLSSCGASGLRGGTSGAQPERPGSPRG